MSEFWYSLQGDLDLATAPKVEADLSVIIIASDAHLRVDCSRLAFIDSTGVRVLVDAYHELLARGRHMLVTNVRPGPRKVFEVLGLDDLLSYDRRVLR